MPPGVLIKSWHALEGALGPLRELRVERFLGREREDGDGTLEQIADLFAFMYSDSTGTRVGSQSDAGDIK